jgi:FkbM family methyltransferase
MKKFERQSDLPYPQPWEWIRDNIEFTDEERFYVDVGANDGIIVSNTAYFDVNLGWSGICIEPHPRAFADLEKNRLRSINLNMCISLEDIEVDFLVIDGYAEMLSGIYDRYHPDHRSRIDSEIQKHGGSKKLVKIKSKPLKKIFEEHSVTKVDYLSIDTEGSEYDILRSIDFDAVNIRVISTENTSRSDIRSFLESKGFVFATQCCADEIYYMGS